MLPSGFGLAQIWPGVISDAPGFSFFRTGNIVNTIDLFIQSQTGDPRNLFTIFSGEQAPLDLISGSSPGTFNFSAGKMSLGKGGIISSPTVTGDLNIFWNGSNSSSSQAGLVIHDTDTSVGSGKPLYIGRTAHDSFYLEESSFLTNRAEFKSNLGGFRSQTFPGPMAYEAVNAFSSSAFSSPVTEGANDSTKFDGFGWGRWDGQQNLFTNLALHKDYAEIGHFLQTSVKQNIGGEGSVVIRNGISPNSYHTSGTTLFSSGDGSFNVITSSGKALQFGPGITGVDRFAHSAAIYKEVSYGNSVSGKISLADNGKVLINEPDNEWGSTFSLYLDEGLPDGFSCEVVTSSPIPGKVRSIGGYFDIEPFPNIPKGNSKAFVDVYNGEAFVSVSQKPVDEIYIPASDFYTSFVSGASGGFHYNAASRSTYQNFSFDAATPSSIEADFVIPREWPGGADFQVNYVALSGAISSSVVWQVESKQFGTSTLLSQAYSPSGTSTSTISATGTVMSASITGLNLFSSFNSNQGTACHVRITRNASNINDSLAADAKFLGLFIRSI